MGFPQGLALIAVSTNQTYQFFRMCFQKYATIKDYRLLIRNHVKENKKYEYRTWTLTSHYTNLKICWLLITLSVIVCTTYWSPSWPLALGPTTGAYMLEWCVTLGRDGPFDRTTSDWHSRINTSNSPATSRFFVTKSDPYSGVAYCLLFMFIAFSLICAQRAPLSLDCPVPPYDSETPVKY